MKKKIYIILIVLAVTGIFGCASIQQVKKTEIAETPAVIEPDMKIKAAIVLSTGGLGDKSFNDSAYRGLKMAKETLGVEFKHVEPVSSEMDEQFLREFAQEGYDIIFATGFIMKEACTKVAKEFPNVKFAIIDEVVELPNVTSLVFKEDEGSFLAGALAAMASKTETVGFVGGMDVPLINKFKSGYEKGVKYIKPDALVLTAFINSENPFNDPAQGRKTALELIDKGADVVYHAAGGTGRGVISAAKETKNLAIGVDSNQDDVEPGFVLTSMVKNVDVAVYNTIKDMKRNKFNSGVNAFGIKEGGVGITEMEFTKNKVPKDALLKIERIKEDIIAGKIKI